MRINFAKFKGALPYTSEIYGVFQALVVWKSWLTLDGANVSLQIHDFSREIDLINQQWEEVEV